MEHFIEVVLELLFGLAKDKPNEMPEIDYMDAFVVKHRTKKTFIRIVVSLLIMAVFSLLWFVIKGETRFLFVIFVILSAIVLLLSLHALSYKCVITSSSLKVSVFGVFRKQIEWKNIVSVRIIQKTNEEDVIIALYNPEGKCVIDFYSDMQNSWYIVKMAEHKCIKIRKEKI